MERCRPELRYVKLNIWGELPLWYQYQRSLALPGLNLPADIWAGSFRRRCSLSRRESSCFLCAWMLLHVSDMTSWTQLQEKHQYWPHRAPSVRETKQKLNPVRPWREAGTVQHKNVCRVAHGLIGIKRSAFVVICRGFRIEGIWCKI